MPPSRPPAAPAAGLSLPALVAAADALPTRVLCTGGVVWRSAGEGAVAGGLWCPAAADGDPAPLPLAAVERWLRRRGVRPVALASPSPHGGDRLALVSAAGALGWRPPLDEIAAAADEAGRSGAALRRVAVRLRPLVDAAEQHALDAAERYAAAAAGAGRAARLLGAPALGAVGVSGGLFVAVDALAGAALRTLAAAEALVARPPGVGARGPAGAPVALRLALAEVRAGHAGPWAARRRVLRRRAAAGLGPPTVRVRRLAVPGGAAWAVRVPAAAPGTGPARRDAFEAAWALATESWRALTLALYAAAGAWAFD